jgi:electron transport complex protein RnfE
MKSITGLFIKGLIARNPTLVILLGMCPSLVVSASVENGLGTGLSALIILTMTNTVLALLRRFIPGQIRLMCYAIAVAFIAVCTNLVMQAVFPITIDALIPLIIANCVVLLYMENGQVRVLRHTLNGLVMGTGFTAALVLLNAVRVVLSDGSRFGNYALPAITGLPAIGFISLGFAFASVQFMLRKHRKRKVVNVYYGEGDET